MTEHYDQREALHAAKRHADDFLMATEQWIESFGFKPTPKRQFSLRVDDKCGGEFEIRLIDSEYGFYDVNLHTYNEVGEHEGGVGLPLVEIRNRGEVRRLCETLGLSLNPAGELKHCSG